MITESVSQGSSLRTWIITSTYSRGLSRHFFQLASVAFSTVNEIATRKGCTPSQLALAWVHHQGDDVCPIPGTTKFENFNENIGALSVKLTPEEMVELQSLASVVKGFRQAGAIPTWLDSVTPPLSSWNGH
ncbi:hypothetical protein Ancab_015218 [Ancistrocladus abbreviatus]